MSWMLLHYRASIVENSIVFPTLGRNVGFTGEIGVLEGRTSTRQYPSIVSTRLRAALATPTDLNGHKKSRISFE